jgi:hypothetical protein
MNTLSTISLLPESKEQKEKFVKQAVTEILSGDYNPIKIYCNLDVAIKTLTEIQKNEYVKEYVAESFREEKTVKFANTEITLTERASYSYENDATWIELNNQILQMKEKIKEYENMLKSLKDDVADMQNGEIYSKPIKTTSKVLTVKLK